MNLRLLSSLLGFVLAAAACTQAPSEDLVEPSPLDCSRAASYNAGMKADMKQFVVVTAVGSDRVGLVDDLSSAILGHGGNIEESHMARLGGEFAGIVLVSGNAEAMKALASALSREGAEIGLHVEIRATTAPAGDARSLPYLLETVSLDTPGILHAVTSLLRTHGVNIEDLETETGSAPFTGAPLFTMRARLSVPSDVHPSRLREALDALGAEQDLDIRLNPVSVP
jgi:glycine cleavage system transcriptional repressor